MIDRRSVGGKTSVLSKLGNSVLFSVLKVGQKGQGMLNMPVDIIQSFNNREDAPYADIGMKKNVYIPLGEPTSNMSAQMKYLCDAPLVDIFARALLV